MNWRATGALNDGGYMIRADIVKYDQYTHTGDSDDENNIHNGCKNTISFDSENIIITSVKNDNDLCAIFFEITPKFMKELNAFVSVIDAHYSDEYD
jgi:hypothetical protein